MKNRKIKRTLLVLVVTSMLMSSGVASTYASGEQLDKVDFVNTLASDVVPDQIVDVSDQVSTSDISQEKLVKSTTEKSEYEYELDNEFLSAKKKISAVEGKDNEWEVETSIRKKPLNKNTDIVILLDNSDNMAYNGRFNKAKENIKKIIDKMLGDNNNKNRIAILSFNGSVKERAPFSSNAEELKSKLDTIRPVYYWGDGAYTQMAFKNARDMLTKENNGNNKQIVILSYGKSTYANKVRDVEKLKTESVDKVNTTRRILGIPLRYQKKKDGIIFVGDFLTLNIFNR